MSRDYHNMDVVQRLVDHYQPSASEFTVEKCYAKRMVWYVESVFGGMYGMALADLEALPVQNRAELERMRETYRLLVNYYKEGVEDPEREKIYKNLGRDLMRYLREAKTLVERQGGRGWVQERAEQMVEAYRVGQGFTLQTLLVALVDQPNDRTMYYERLELGFNWVLGSCHLSAEEQGALSAFFREEHRHAALTLISALFVSSMECFDRRKIELLKAIVQHADDEQLRAYALPALLLLGRRHQTELLLQHTDLVAEVEQLLQFKVAPDELFLSIKTIFMAYHTKDVVKRYREKILPEIMGLSQRIQNLMGGALQQLFQSGEEMMKMDPEQAAEMSELERLMEQKQREFEQMTDGEMDLHYLMTKNIQRSSFFQKVLHWFIPYDEQHPAIDKEAVALLKEVEPMMARHFPIISSDRYALVTMPMIESMIQNIRRQLDGMPLPKDVMPRKADFEVAVRDFVFGLYRFYHLSDQRADLLNPFRREPFIPDGAFTQRAEVLPMEHLEKWGQQLIRHQKMRLVRLAYERLVAQYRLANGDSMRALGGVALSENEPQKAVAYLKRAIELEGATPITVKMVAEELMQRQRLDEAKDFLETYEPQIEGKGALPLTTMRLDLAEEADDLALALSLAYKADFLNEGEHVADVATLARILLKQGEVERAITLLEERAERFQADKDRGILTWYLGLGHLAKGERQAGLVHFTEIAEQQLYTPVLSQDIVGDTLPLLLRYDYGTWEVGLIKDIVYDLFK